jgi:hypothetical protein
LTALHTGMASAVVGVTALLAREALQRRAAAAGYTGVRVAEARG